MVPLTWKINEYEGINKTFIACNVAVMFSSSLKILTVLRTYSEFGKLIALLAACVVDIQAFLSFLILIILMIATVYKLIGVDYI